MSFRILKLTHPSQVHSTQPREFYGGSTAAGTLLGKFYAEATIKPTALLQSSVVRAELFIKDLLTLPKLA